MQMTDSVLEINVLHDDMSDDNKDATIAKHTASFVEAHHGYVQTVFDGANGLNVRTINIKYSVADGLWVALGAFYVMRDGTERKLPIPDLIVPEPN